MPATMRVREHTGAGRHGDVQLSVLKMLVLAAVPRERGQHA